MSERKITSSEIFGPVDPDTENITPGEKRYLRKSRASDFAQEVRNLVKERPAEDSRKTHKKSVALPVNLNGETIYVRAVKQTQPQNTFGRIHYIDVDYKLMAINGEDQYPLFTFTETLYPNFDDPYSFSHGDTKILNMHGKLASHHEALEGLWAVRMLSEQLEGLEEKE